MLVCVGVGNSVCFDVGNGVGNGVDGVMMLVWVLCLPWSGVSLSVSVGVCVDVSVVSISVVVGCC